MNAALNDELSLLRELVVTLKAALENTQRENSLLRQKVDALVRRVFGSSSEKLDPAQLELLVQLAAPTVTSPAPVMEKPTAVVNRPRKERAPRLPEHLPVVEEVSKRHAERHY